MDTGLLGMVTAEKKRLFMSKTWNHAFENYGVLSSSAEFFHEVLKQPRRRSEAWLRALFMTDVPVDLRNTMLALVSTVRVVLLEKKSPYVNVKQLKSRPQLFAIVSWDMLHYIAAIEHAFKPFSRTLAKPSKPSENTIRKRLRARYLESK